MSDDPNAEEPKKRRRRRDWEGFIETWQTSSTVAEVCEKTGYKETTVRRYAWQLRKRGVPLSTLGDENPQRSRADWDRLRNLAMHLATDASGPGTRSTYRPPAEAPGASSKPEEG